jgi:hypothetical protein
VEAAPCGVREEFVDRSCVLIPLRRMYTLTPDAVSLSGETDRLAL